MGTPEWTAWDLFKTTADRVNNQDVIEMKVEEWLVDHTMEEVFEIAAKARLPIAPVANLDLVLEMEQLKSRDYFQQLEHPAAGNLIYAGAPYKLTTNAWQLRRPAPLLGQHNREVFEQLGISKDEFVRLEKAGVI
jgi:CoA:oxalate CoA-transferase